MPFKEIRKKETLLKLRRYDREGFIGIPMAFREHFMNRVKLLFDPQKNLLALQPSDEVADYPTSHWRVWCTAFFKEYNIPSQDVVAVWDKKNSYLIAKIGR